MASKIRALQMAVLLAVATPCGASSSTHAATPQSKYGAWDFHCEQPPGSSREHCVLFQRVISEEKSEVEIGVIIIKRAELRNGIMQVVAPLSVLLTKGVSLKIDQSDVGQLAFFRCFEAGCRAETIFDEKLFERLSNGKMSTIVIYMAPHEGLRHLVPLTGFKEGFEKLK